MKTATYILLTIVMIWMPVGTATAFVCGSPAPMMHDEAGSEMAGEPERCHGKVHMDDSDMSAGECASLCAALAHVSLPADALILPGVQATEALIESYPARLLPAHSHPPIRPPQDHS
ncbi:hypothetical protein [uncultured Abyssibacter sp.]|uniref:hypothetical protein n=1 Tax=uncultured Abyssibacter sp. TaxID=2320202 RepID=UPI0032B2FB8E